MPHGHASPHQEAHRQTEALVRDGLLERIVRPDGSVAYRAITPSRPHTGTS